MKNIFLSGLSIFICGAVLLPSVTQAYEVTNRQMVHVSDTFTMYTLEFKFGFVNADMWMPIMASKSLKEGNHTTSAVLSTAPIEGNKYFVPMKETATFTLLVLEEHAVGKSKGSITVEKLPITLQRKGEKPIVRIFEGEDIKDFTVGKK